MEIDMIKERITEAKNRSAEYKRLRYREVNKRMKMQKNFFVEII